MRRLLLTIAFVLAAAPVIAAPAPVNVSDAGATNSSGSNTLSWSFDAVSGGCANCAMLVTILSDQTVDDLIGCNYNSVAMTVLDKANVGWRWIYTLGLTSPSSGSNNIDCTASATHLLSGQAISYSGVGSFGAHASQGGFGTNVTGSITTSTANSWVFLAAGAPDVTTWAGITNATIRNFYVTNNSPALFDNNTAIAAGSYSMTVSTGQATDLAIVMVELVPSGGGGGTPAKRVLTLGVGAPE